MAKRAGNSAMPADASSSCYYAADRTSHCVPRGEHIVFMVRRANLAWRNSAQFSEPVLRHLNRATASRDING
jgi:hypothetical protein